MPRDELPPIREALDPIATPYLSSISSTVSGNFSIAKEVLMGSFTSEHRRSESTRILSDRKPFLFQEDVMQGDLIW
jgi:hypothetical protein